MTVPSGLSTVTDDRDPCPNCGDTTCDRCQTMVIATFPNGLTIPPGGQVLARVWARGPVEMDTRPAFGGWMPVGVDGATLETERVEP